MPQPSHTQTQVELIRKHLEDGRRITAIDALNFYQCMNLKGRIFDLRSEPYNLPVQKNWIKLPSGKHIAQYYLLKQTIKRLTNDKAQATENHSN